MRTRRHAQQGQALILALVLIGLLSAFSVSILRLASASSGTAASVRESAYRDAEREAGALMARQLVADGLGCPMSTVTANFAAGEAIKVYVAQSPGCATPDPDGDSATGTVPGPYLLCSTVTVAGVGYPATITVSAHLGAAAPNVNVDIVRFAPGKDQSCP